MRLGDIAVYKAEFAPTHHDDGRPRLFQIAPDFSAEPTLFVPFDSGARPPKQQPPKPQPPKRWCVLVHPSRWDAFFMAINQPDVFAHPEVQELLGLITRAADDGREMK